MHCQFLHLETVFPPIHFSTLPQVRFKKKKSISVEQYIVNLLPQVAQKESNHSVYSQL